MKIHTTTKFFFYTFVCVTICFLLLKINLVLDGEKYYSFNQIILNNKRFWFNIQFHSNIGWFNLEKNNNYEISSDLDFLILQNIIAPTILENHAYNKLVICYYTSNKQLYSFCKKNKTYNIIQLDILGNYALLERKN